MDISKKLTQNKLIWLLFFISSLSAIILSIFNVYAKVEPGFPFYFFTYLLPFIAVYMHCHYMLGPKKSLLFIMLTFTISGLFEIAGINYGVAFSGNYIYNMHGPTIARLPVVIPVFWFIFIYSVYGFINTVVIENGGSLPNHQNRNKKLLLKIITLDALLVMMIDLVMEPVMIKWGEWSWTNGGLYFNIPIMNFVGWFIVALIISLLFRTYEYHHPFNKYLERLSINYIPLVGYIMIIFTFTLLAFFEGINKLGLLSLFIYIPFLVLIILRLKKNKTAHLKS